MVLFCLFADGTDSLIFLLLHTLVQLFQTRVLLLQRGDSLFEIIYLFLGTSVYHFLEVGQVLWFFELRDEVGKPFTIIIELLEIRSRPVLLGRHVYFPLELLILLTKVLTFSLERLYNFVVAFVFLLVIFHHDLFQDRILVLQLLDRIFIWNGQLVLLVLKFMDGTLQLVVLVADGEVIVFLLEEGIFIA